MMGRRNVDLVLKTSDGTNWVSDDPVVIKHLGFNVQGSFLCKISQYLFKRFFYLLNNIPFSPKDFGVFFEQTTKKNYQSMQLEAAPNLNQLPELLQIDGENQKNAKMFVFFN